MENTNQSEERYFRAKKEIEDIKGFYGNLTSYILVNIGFLVLNLITSPNHLWFYWPLLGWGIGVIIHGIGVFNCLPYLGKDWEERKIREIIEKDKYEK
jgi:hypothetical protein